LRITHSVARGLPQLFARQAIDENRQERLDSRACTQPRKLRSADAFDPTSLRGELSSERVELPRDTRVDLFGGLQQHAHSARLCPRSALAASVRARNGLAALPDRRVE
jgi:hypothetical protein